MANREEIAITLLTKQMVGIVTLVSSLTNFLFFSAVTSVLDIKLFIKSVEFYYQCISTK